MAEKTNKGETQHDRSKKKRLPPAWSWRKVSARWPVIVLLVVVFFIGVGVGNGHLAIDWHRNGAVATGLPAKLNYASVNQVYQSLKQNYDGQLTQDQLLDGLKHGLAQATNDPYTAYFTAAEAKQFNNELNNAFSGIGAQLGADSDGDLQVIA